VKRSTSLLSLIGAHRAFKAMGRLYCSVPGVRGIPELQGRRAEGRGSYTLRHAAGTEIRRAAPSLIAVAPDGPVMRLIGLSVDGIPDGNYELILHVLDETSGRNVEHAERFRLESSVP
jgi:hypothetical protein